MECGTVEWKMEWWNDRLTTLYHIYLLRMHGLLGTIKYY